MRQATLQIPRIVEGQALSEAERARFADLLQQALGCRKDRTRNLLAWGVGVAAAPAGRLCVETVAKATDGLATPKQLRNVIEDAPLDERLLRLPLVRAAPLNRVRAFTIEQRYVPDADGDGGNDLYTLSAVGPDFLVPLGWEIEPIPPADAPGEVSGIDYVEERAVTSLLQQLKYDYAATGPVTTGFPVVILQAPGLGANREMRMSVGGLHPEYIARVHGCYNDLHLRSDDPFEPVEPDRQLQDYFAPVPAGANPPPRELLDASLPTSQREWAVWLPDDGDDGYVIVRPDPLVPPGGLRGPMARDRASKLGELASEIADTHTAEHLRVADFRHKNPVALRRHGLLMSLLSTFGAHRLSGANR
jgi:hypothetical protein